LPFNELHIPRSLAKARRKLALTCTFDQAFRAVMEECRSVPRPGQDGTWITAEVLEGYCALHTLGDAHSAEAWDENGELVGGVYGVDAGGVFAGESMFFTRPYASKIALLHLVEHLQACGCPFLDIQMLTPHMEAMGAKEIPRALFLRRLQEEQAKGRRLF
jgi:leucyl/phenylalanyl-tRNA--protein transferase